MFNIETKVVLGEVVDHPYSEGMKTYNGYTIICSTQELSYTYKVEGHFPVMPEGGNTNSVEEVREHLRQEGAAHFIKGVQLQFKSILRALVIAGIELGEG